MQAVVFALGQLYVLSVLRCEAATSVAGRSGWQEADVADLGGHADEL